MSLKMDRHLLSIWSREPTEGIAVQSTWGTQEHHGGRKQKIWGSSMSWVEMDRLEVWQRSRPVKRFGKERVQPVITVEHRTFKQEP